MRKVWSFSLAAMLIALVASPGAAQNLRLGAKTGIDFANLGGDAEEFIGASTDMKLGFSAGAFFGADLGRLFRLQFEGQYVRKGTTLKSGGEQADINISYIEFLVPATVRIPVEGGVVTPRVYAGPSVGIEASCKISGEESGVSIDVDCDNLGLTERKTLDFGVFGGVGVDFRLGSGELSLDALYNLGIVNLNDDPGTSEFSVTNNNIQLLVGYAILFGS